MNQTIKDVIPVPYCVSMETQKVSGIMQKVYHIHILKSDIEKVDSDEFNFDKLHFPFLITAELPDTYHKEIKFGDYILSNYDGVRFHVFELLESDFSRYYRDNQQAVVDYINRNGEE